MGFGSKEAGVEVSDAGDMPIFDAIEEDAETSAETAGVIIVASGTVEADVSPEIFVPVSILDSDGGRAGLPMPPSVAGPPCSALMATEVVVVGSKSLSMLRRWNSMADLRSLP